MPHMVKPILLLPKTDPKESFYLVARSQFPKLDLEKSELLNHGKINTKREKAISRTLSWNWLIYSSFFAEKSADSEYKKT